MREARSRGTSAGSDRPVVGCVGVRSGWRVGAVVKPGGGGMIVGVGEKKVRRGLEGMGVPSSSSNVGGRGAIREESSRVTGGWMGVQGVVSLWETGTWVEVLDVVAA